MFKIKHEQRTAFLMPSLNRERKEAFASTGDIWLDISRLLFNVLRGRITGIDRVEIAYAEHLLEAVPERTKFVAYDYWRGSFRMLDQSRAARLIRSITPAWNAGTMKKIRRLAWRAFFDSLFTSSIVPGYRGGPRPVYINVSSHPLHLVERIGKMTARTGALFVPLVHDLIPIAFPEYVPPPWVKYHEARLKTIASFADGVISNSDVTASALREYVPVIPIATVPLGVGDLFSQSRERVPSQAAASRPYFVVIGTIEPRKNHLLLLNVWRRLVKEMGDSAPDLMIIGRRGWENEQVLDMLERSRDIENHVHECGMISDVAMTDLLAGARALLLPSFFEGYSLPVVEAITMGIPVICSDIEAHREVGRDVPAFIDPLDGTAWLKAIKDYTDPDSVARAAQLERISGWSSPCWRIHIATMLEFVAELSPRRPAKMMKSKYWRFRKLVKRPSWQPSTGLAPISTVAPAGDIAG